MIGLRNDTVLQMSRTKILMVELWTAERFNTETQRLIHNFSVYILNSSCNTIRPFALYKLSGRNFVMVSAA